MTFLETAIGLARRGFSVFPVLDRQKAPPLVREWQSVATRNEDQLRIWSEQWPNANCAIHCAGLLVLDIDPKKGGYESLETLEKEIELEATYEVETPSGGRHIYYALPAGASVRNGVDLLGAGIDVRTTSGYVVGAGSRTDAGDYRVAVDEPVAGADSALLERLRVRHEPSRDVSPASVDTDPDAAIARAKDFLRTHPVAVEGQGGDHHTFRTIARLRDFGVPEERAAETLAEWNERCTPPWEEADLAVKIANAYRYAQDAAGKLTPEALGFEVIPGADLLQNVGTSAQVPTDRNSPEPGSESPNLGTELLHPADVGIDDVLGAEYLIKGVLERRSNAVLFGHWNVGKTFVVLDMAAAIATGTPWFERRVRQGRVLYLGYEGIRAMKKRMFALKTKYPALTDPATPLAWHPMRQPLTKGEGVQELGGILTAFSGRHGGPPDLIVIDPLANALGGDDADANLMGVLNDCVAKTMQKQHCTVLRVHHSGHGNQDRARGHSSLPAGVDTEIRVDEQEIALTKQRDDVRGKASFRLEVVMLGRDLDGDPVTTCVVHYVEDNAMSPHLTVPQRELLDELLRLRGNKGRVTKADVRDCSSSVAADVRKKLVDVLERKQYLKADGDGWVIAERGPMAIFD